MHGTNQQHMYTNIKEESLGNRIGNGIKPEKIRLESSKKGNMLVIFLLYN